MKQPNYQPPVGLNQLKWLGTALVSQKSEFKSCLGVTFCGLFTVLLNQR